ncbi:7740_t:CDS:2 [Acaulospora colombiana]|uniref:7740_t:CDS:1 n=1 Tax=Acaulospora colombiana TaxID=27376 RepID=A0ACA9KKT2_9GLOM|nr:7740_t:CDS:2 [Acaulospora colombiana]
MIVLSSKFWEEVMLIVDNSSMLLLKEDWSEREVIGEGKSVKIIGECVFIDG